MAETDIYETVGALKAGIKAAHDRTDRLELGVRKELEKIMDKLGAIETWMHRTQGQQSLMIVIGSLFSAGVTLLVSHYLK